MNRRAIIIDARKAVKVESGEWSDVAKFRQLLLSAVGGAWKSQEVLSSRVTTSQQTIDTARSAAGVEFSMILYLGAGVFTKRDRPWSEIEITLPSGETLSERDINPGTPRCLMVCDFTNCYEPTNAWMPENESPEIAARARHLYLDCLDGAEAGLVRVVGCATSPEPNQAQSLIAALLRVASQWHESGSDVLGIDGAIEKLKTVGEAQRCSVAADYFGGRRLRHFPFVISPNNGPK